MKRYFKKINLEIVLIVLVVLIGAFLRLYHVELFGFANDQARDANIAREIIHGKFVYEGPEFSVDTTGPRGHLGPFYFYLIAPVYFIFSGDPLGNVLLIGFLRIASIYLIYLIGKKYLNATTGIISALVLCFSYYTIYHSRFPWNPHVMIFFVLLILLFLEKAVNKDEKYYLAVALALATVTQTQASAFLFIPCFLILFLFKLIKWPKVWIILLSIAIFLVTYIPLLLYDLKHNFVNSKAYLDLALGRGRTPEYVASGKLPFVRPFMDYFNSLLGINLPYEKILFVLIGLVLIGTILYIMICVKSNLSKIIAIFGGVFMASFAFMAYRNALEEYFFLVITPFVILILAYFFSKMLKVNTATRILAIFFIVLFIFQSQKLYWEDVSGKINRSYEETSSAQTLLPDTKNAVNYMIEEVKKNSDSLDKTFTVNYLQTCPPTYAINYLAFDYIFNLKGATPSQDPSTKINFYVIQPPESLACALIPKENIVDQKQFGKVLVITSVKR